MSCSDLYVFLRLYRRFTRFSGVSERKFDTITRHQGHIQTISCSVKLALKWPVWTWFFVIFCTYSGRDRNCDRNTWNYKLTLNHCQLVCWLFIMNNWLVVWVIKCQKIVQKCQKCFLKPEMTSANILLCPQPKDTFTVTEEERNRIVTVSCRQVEAE